MVAIFSGLDARGAAFWAWMSLLFGFLFQVYLLITGRGAKAFKEGRSSNKYAVGDHRVYARILTGFIITGVVGIEVAVRKVGGEWGGWLFTFHLTLVVMAAILLGLALFRTTGIEDKKRHWKVVYAFFISYSASFITGTVLLLEKFPWDKLIARWL